MTGVWSGEESVQLKRTEQNAVFPREHGEFQPPLPLQGIIITAVTGSRHTVSIEALQVSPSMAPKSPGSKHQPLGWHNCDCPPCCFVTPRGSSALKAYFSMPLNGTVFWRLSWASFKSLCKIALGTWAQRFCSHGLERVFSDPVGVGSCQGRGPGDGHRRRWLQLPTAWA